MPNRSDILETLQRMLETDPALRPGKQPAPPPAEPKLTTAEPPIQAPPPPIEPADDSEIDMVVERVRTPHHHTPRFPAPPIHEQLSHLTRARIEPFQPFPTGALPQPVRDFVDSGAQAVSCDPSYVALPILAAVAGAVGNARALQLKRNWHVPVIIWSATVGQSGSAKSPAFHLALRPFRDRQTHLLNEHAQALHRRGTGYDRALDAWLDKPEGLPPKRPEQPRLVRSLVVDTTLSALGPLLAENPRGLLLARDDLAGWVIAFVRSAAGKGKVDASHWFPMHDGQSLLIDRLIGSARSVFVERAALSVAGAMQPALLKRALDSGLASRLLVSWPPRSKQPKCWTTRELDRTVESQFAQFVDGLYALQPETSATGQPAPVVLQLDKQAQAAWQTWYNLHGQEQTSLTGDLLAAWSKLEEYAARLALVVHCVRCATHDPKLRDPLAVDLASLEAGITLANWFKAETRRVYALLSESAAQRSRRQLIDWITRKGGSATTRDVQTGNRRYATASAAEAALQDLFYSGAGHWEYSDTDKPGHPTRRFVLFDESES